MGRSSINWMNPDVQQSIDDYIQRKIPTQAKLRQVISNHLQQHISEQALSIYLKRSGFSGYSRKTNSPTSLKPNQSIDSSPGGGVGDILNSTAASKQQSIVASSTIASLSSALSAHQLPTAAEHFYNQQHPLFLNGVNGGGAGGACGSPSAASSSSAAVIVDPNSSSVNFVHVSSPATFSNMSSNSLLRGEDTQQQLHRAAEIQHNLQLQQQLQWQQQSNQANANNNGSVNSNNSGAGGDVGNNTNMSKAKRSSTSSQPINWKDPVVQCAISNYFNKKIKLQTELRQVIMQRLKRNISENSLRLHLKKLKSSYDSSGSASSSQTSIAPTSNNAATVLINDAFRHLSTTKDNASLQEQTQQHHGLTTATSSICPTATAMPIISSPSKEFYYFCNNIAGFASQPVYATTTGLGTQHSMLGSIDTYGFNDGGVKSLHMAPATMVKTINEQFIKVSNNAGAGSADLQSSMVNDSNDSISGKSDKNSIVLDDVKPSVRRRINWGNTEVQNAIQDFYDRKILTQAKLRSIIESILGQVVSEQALSIYLKRKKSRNPTSEEVLLMNINCVDENIN